MFLGEIEGGKGKIMVVGILEKNYVTTGNAPTVTLTTDDCEAVKNSLHIGDQNEIETLVWMDNTIQERKRVKATIDHICPKGIRVYFWHRNWKSLVQVYRYLSYVDIILDRRNGKIPFATTGF